MRSGPRIKLWEPIVSSCEKEGGQTEKDRKESLLEGKENYVSANPRASIEAGTTTEPKSIKKERQCTESTGELENCFRGVEEVDASFTSSP